MGRRAVAATLLVCAAPVVAIATWTVWPVPRALLDDRGGRGVTIEDRNGVPLRSTRAEDGSRARWIPYEQLDADVINAFVAVEDRRFWEHHGVDLRAVVRAARDNRRAGRVVSGASTITMQLARLLRPASRSWRGKVGEALWALRLERQLGKQRILEEYLNRVHLGQAAEGVGAAAALYFDAAPSELSIGQAATLAGLAHAPSRDNPYTSPRRARARRLVALARMRREGYATRDDVARARQEPMVAPRRRAPFLAPHFSTRVLAWMAEERMPATERVRTSLDAGIQQALEAEVRHTVETLRHRRVDHAAAVAIDNESGEVLAWVGSPDFWSADDGQTDLVVSPRQPGSALKPFLYALALDRGFTAASVLPDIPKSYATATGAYHPRNYDRRFRGPVRAREALASSYNVPAVELAERLGAPALLHTLHLAGFSSLRRPAEHYGLGLALGNGDVTLIELANGYRALANGGTWRPWGWRVVAPGARSADATERRVASPAASAIVLDILADPGARLPGFGASTPFEFPFPVAVKTGTSRHFTDNWAVGVTRRFTVAVWAGNFSGRPMEGVSGISGAGPLLHRAVMAVARTLPPGVLQSPAEVGATRVPVCRLSGLLATRECAQLAEWFVPGTVPTRADDWERDGRIALPDEYAEWAHQGLASDGEATVAEARIGVEGGVASQAGAPLPTPRDASAPGAPRRPTGFRIVSPQEGDRYAIPADVEARYATIPLRAAGPGAAEVRWEVDGKRHAGDRLRMTPGPHVIRASSPAGKSAEVRIVVEP